jgi:hypothetical protein
VFWIPGQILSRSIKTNEKKNISVFMRNDLLFLPL